MLLFIFCHTNVHGHIAQARPSYPEALLNKIQYILPTKSPVVDLADGTGLMTKVLVARGFNVAAVEPVANMRKKLMEQAVIVAQAFHWFDDIKTLEEIHHILKPGGYGVLAWNLESGDRSKWVANLRKFYEEFDAAVPQFRKMKWHQVFDTEKAKALFAMPYQSEIFYARLLGSKTRCLETSFQQNLHSLSEFTSTSIKSQDRCNFEG
ncbi:hypothetical protein [Parasitella parasitica]|uniref:Methyltransferase type 11 domain-containing protein n=1 Tax=Parasitella parasitica TaxID=35722 RepID=A0A0B7NUP0_9FUNG|nr:hypothetical protein [Parasitella parasitica]